MKIRVMFEQPQLRPSFIGNEIENIVTIDLSTGKAIGYFGSFEQLPVDPTQEAVRHTSSQFEVQLTVEDLLQILSVVKGRAGEQGAGGATPNSIWTVDGQRVP